MAISKIGKLAHLKFSSTVEGSSLLNVINIIIIIIIITYPLGLEIPGGNRRGIFSPLAVRLRCIQKIKWKAEVKTYITSSVAWINWGRVPQGS